MREREIRVLRGIAYVVLATVLFVVMNSGAKHLSRDLPTVQIIWARTLGHLLFVLAAFAPAHDGWRLLATRRLGLQCARSLLLLTSTSFFFTALGRVPLADATAVSFTSPLLVAALAGPLLGERVGAGHWIAIALGFVGALLVIRPTGEGSNPYVLLVLGSASCYAMYQPATVSQWLILSGLGILGALGHYCVARAAIIIASGLSIAWQGGPGPPRAGGDESFPPAIESIRVVWSPSRDLETSRFAVTSA